MGRVTGQQANPDSYRGKGTSRGFAPRRVANSAEGVGGDVMPEQSLGSRGFDALTARSMPESPEAEAAVLGSMIVEPVCISDVVEKLRREDFYRHENRIIWDALIALYDKNKGQGVDGVLVRSELANCKLLEEAGGVEYLSRVMDSVPSSANVMYYTNIVKDKAMLREMIAAAGEILEDAFNGVSETGEKLDRAEQRIFAVTDKRISQNAIPLKDLVTRSYELIERRDGKLVTGLPTGYHSLDQLTCGLQNGEMIIVAGRPSMGKTSLALNIAEHLGVVEKMPVAIFSLEMGRQQLAERFLCSKSGIDAQLVKKGMLSTEQYHELALSCGDLSDAPIYIDDTPSLTPLELRAKSRRLRSQHNIRAVFVDYLQLMGCGDGRIESRQQEVSLISRYLKALAKELDIPVVVLSQLNRTPEGRLDHRPRMSDLRESGSIEQDADVVILLHREDYYHSKKLGSTLEEDAAASSGVSGGGEYKPTNKAEIIIAKQRNGPTDTVELVFRERMMRFENPSYAEAPF